MKKRAIAIETHADLRAYYKCVAEPLTDAELIARLAAAAARRNCVLRTEALAACPRTLLVATFARLKAEDMEARLP